MQRSIDGKCSKDQDMVQNYLSTDLGPMRLLLLRRLHVDIWPGHNVLILVSHASYVILQYTCGGHGAADEPLAAHTAMVQVDCYSWEKAGFSLDLCAA